LGSRRRDLTQKKEWREGSPRILKKRVDHGRTGVDADKEFRGGGPLVKREIGCTKDN